MPNEPGTKKLLLVGAKDLCKSYPRRAQKAGIDIELFHNRKIEYSAIQLSRFQGAPEWTAYGETAVQTLYFWYQLFQEECGDLLRNTVVIKEQYSPEFLAYQKTYRVRPILINDNMAKSLNEMKDKFLRYQRLEKYLFGNLNTFFQFIAYSFNKEERFLKVSIQEAHPYTCALPIFHQNKKTAFDIKFKCNFRLPQTLRLGQSTALGYGKVIHF